MSVPSSHAERLTIHACMSQLLNSENENRLKVNSINERGGILQCRVSCSRNVTAEQAGADVRRTLNVINIFTFRKQHPEIII